MLHAQGSDRIGESLTHFDCWSRVQRLSWTWTAKRDTSPFHSSAALVRDSSSSIAFVRRQKLLILLLLLLLLRCCFCRCSLNHFVNWLLRSHLSNSHRNRFSSSNLNLSLSIILFNLKSQRIFEMIWKDLQYQHLWRFPIIFFFAFWYASHRYCYYYDYYLALSLFMVSYVTWGVLTRREAGRIDDPRNSETNWAGGGPRCCLLQW